MPLDPCGRRGERRAVAVEVDGVGDGRAAVAEELLLVLLGDAGDDGMGPMGVAEYLDRHPGQAGALEDLSPQLVEAEEGPSSTLPRDQQVFRSGGPLHLAEEPGAVRAEVDPAPPAIAPVALGSGDADARHRALQVGHQDVSAQRSSSQWRAPV